MPDRKVRYSEQHRLLDTSVTWNPPSLTRQLSSTSRSLHSYFLATSTSFHPPQGRVHPCVCQRHTLCTSTPASVAAASHKQNRSRLACQTKPKPTRKTIHFVTRNQIGWEFFEKATRSSRLTIGNIFAPHIESCGHLRGIFPSANSSHLIKNLAYSKYISQLTESLGPLSMPSC